MPGLAWRRAVRLVVFSGLPGTGKTALAGVAAKMLECPLFS